MYWILVCSKGFSSVGSKSGTYDARSPSLKSLKMPLRNPDSCDLTASMSNDIFGPGGRITIMLYAVK